MDDLKKAVNAPERLIDANELMEWLRIKIRECVFMNAHAEAATTEEIIRYVNHMPAVPAVPVVHGAWEVLGDCGITRCLACKWNFEGCIDYKYCPNCGARMDGETDG